jgi:hypothetical protein
LALIIVDIKIIQKLGCTHPTREGAERKRLDVAYLVYMKVALFN